MYNNAKVISVTPYGRRRYLPMLATYLLRNRDIIDEHHFWINTSHSDDIADVVRLVGDNKGFFRIVEIPEPYAYDWSAFRIHKFFPSYAHPDTVYVRFDDDIVWFASDAISELIRFRLANPQYFLVHANVVNNSLCTHLHQRFGLLAPNPFMEYHCMGDNSWHRWETARDAHNALIASIHENSLRRFMFDRWELSQFERCSINCIAWLGSDFATFGGSVGQDEEDWLAVRYPKECGRINCICGTALVSHFAYFTQRENLEAQTNLLDVYAGLAACS